MSIHDLRLAQAQFKNQIEDILDSRQTLYSLRNDFAKYYSNRRISAMSLEQYAIGNRLPSKGYNFCYAIERQLDGLGRIIGATAFKFGVYYGRVKSDPTYKYRFTKKFGENKNEALGNIKSEIKSLISAGKSEDMEAIIKNKISPMFKGKILSTYYPERYLNIFSDNHLEYFLVQLNIDNHDLIWSDAVVKRDALMAFKNNDEVMKKWPNDLFSYFLYHVYPGRPSDGKNASGDPLKDYKDPEFPVDPDPIWIEMDIKPPKPKGKSKGSRKGEENPDYEKEARRNKKVGDRGEKLVMDMEKLRLEKAGLLSLSKKVKKAKYDCLGYDVLSYDESGKVKHIEVKTTKAKVGAANFFLSINEYNKSKELSNYNVYVVFDILSESPKVWQVGNPFKPKNKNVRMTPVSYRIEINSKYRKKHK